MTDLTKEQLAEGKKVLEGPTIYFWVLAVIAGIGILSQNSIALLSKGINLGPVSIGFPGVNSIWIFAALYVASLVGFHMRKSWAVPVARAGLVVSMVVLFPVGTIFGAILWKRINDPIAKRYLGYQTDEPSAADTKTTTAGTGTTTAGTGTTTANTVTTPANTVTTPANTVTTAETSAASESNADKITITEEEKPEEKA